MSAMAMRIAGRLVAMLTVVVLTCVAGGVGVASAEGVVPWWGLTAGERPTNLKPGVAKDTTMQLTVNATSGAYTLKENGTSSFRCIAAGASAATVQTAVEEIYSGVVEVSGGPGDSGGTKPYLLRFPAQTVQAGTESQPDTLEASKALAEFGFCSEPAVSGGGAEVGLVGVSVGVPDGRVVVDAQNRGDTGTGGVVSVVAGVPAGLRAVAIEGDAGGTPGHGNNRGVVTCSLKLLSCSFSESLPAYEQIEVRVAVVVQGGASSGERVTGSVSGGGAARPVSVAHGIEVNGRERFGVEDFQLVPEEPGGLVDTQAGSHPFQLTNVTTFNSALPDEQGRPRAVGLAKDVLAELPAGFIGDPTPFAQCSDTQFSKEPASTHTINECPAQSAVGAATVTFTEPNSVQFDTVTAPIFNMKPRRGEPARFGFKAEGIIPAFLDASVRTGGDYGVTITSSNIIQIASLLSVKLTFWGVPGDPRHDHQRGWECIQEFGSCPASTDPAPPPFLVMPTSCEAPFQATLRADSWGSSAGPSQQAEPVTYRLGEGIDGCDRLPFSPSVTVAPDIQNASSPTGLSVDVHVPQSAELNPEGLAESAVKNITLTFPEGVALNPAGADGLEACSETQTGFTGIEPGSGRDLFTAGQVSCPDASKVATARIKLPILPNALEGAVYLAAQNNNPFGSLVAAYIIAEDPVSGVLIKLSGEVSLNPQTGQITSTFLNNPQGPLEDAEFHFFGGERAPFATPSHCGVHTTSATFTPWSGNAPVTSTSSFEINSGPHTNACPGGALPFTPSLTGGSTNIQAGAFSPLTTTITREDGQQDLQAVTLHMPAGLSGLLSSVKLCGENEANAGTCSPESLIGETVVSVGLGADPFSVTGGKVYITGPYHGAPFGLSIVNPAKAGPYDLGKVIVRAKIEVDLHTAALTITTDPSGPYAIPHILDGIPLQIKHVNVLINRPGFTFNPTNCNPMTITGNITSSENTTAPVSVAFQATNCQTLKFTPTFTVSTSGRTSKANGASLTAKLSYPNTPPGTQANIAAVKVDLPRQLPSRLSTLQKACLAAVFETNPANCPPASIIGHATVHTPLLPVPLTGPAYFVSHGGEAFPSLTIDLQGYGVTVNLIGSTFIRKGITSTTFKTTPDIPFNTFELTLPQARNSALAANGNLCKTKLNMPTLLTAQNGNQKRQTTKITTTNCPKPHKHHTTKHTTHHNKK